MKILAVFVLMVSSSISFASSTSDCREWSQVYNGYAGLQGYYCTAKPEANLKNANRCKSWKYVYLSGHGIEGYICDSKPSINNSGDTNSCKTWANVYDSKLPMNGYICKEIM